MKVFVTGGAGYVGSHCVRALCDADHEVVVFDNLQAGHRRAVDSRATLIIGDLADTGLIERTLSRNGFEAVLHFAGVLDVNESVLHPLRYYRINLACTISLLEAMRKHRINKMVFSSTCATYGVPTAVPIREDMPQHPINPYGRTKLAIEWALRDSAAAWGLGATALRYFNAAGAAPDAAMGEDHKPETHLIPLVLRVALGEAKQIRIFGTDYPTPDGTCVRDYIHVQDLADAHRIALDHQTAGTFQCFNIGTGVGVSVQELIDAARTVTGHEIPAVPAARREGDPPKLYAEPSKVTSEFGWQPRYVDIRETVETAWTWHRTHPRGYDDEGSRPSE